MASGTRRGFGGRAARARGLTLVEVLIVVALMGLLTGFATLGLGVAKSARLRRSAVMVAGAVRIAYAHANAISRPVRLVFDLEQKTLTLEEGTGTLAMVKGERSGGAEAATEAEREAKEEAEKILAGPRAPRPTFQPSKAFGWDAPEGATGKQLAEGIRFVHVETGHQDEPEMIRAYLYFWPGGQTERAAIVLTKAGADDDETEEDMLTVLVSPLRGKAVIEKGKAPMPRPRDESEESEREDTGP